MRTLFIIITMLFLTVNNHASCADGDITRLEVRPNVTKYVLDSAIFLMSSKSCEVVYRKIDSNGNHAGDKTVSFLGDEFDSLISSINSGNNIRKTIKSETKRTLGI